VSNGKLDISRLDMIIKKTIEAIDASKNQIYEIAEGACICQVKNGPFYN
jgi:two-component system sensor histidine kinase DegS